LCFRDSGLPVVASELKKRGLDFWFMGEPFTIIMYVMDVDRLGVVYNDGGSVFTVDTNRFEMIDHVTSKMIGRTDLLPYVMNASTPLNISAEPLMQNLDTDCSRIVVPVQRAIWEGAVIPWYGAVGKDANESIGAQYGPMLSPNIKNDVEYDSDEYLELWEYREMDLIEMEGYDICTGDRDPALNDSFGTLNEANCDSAYHTMACDKHPKAIADGMIRGSLKIYKGE
jgi:hypothetical protein